MAKKAAARTWMRVLVNDDVDRLKQLLAAKGSRWQRCEYKLHRGNIIISVPITPLDPKTGNPDPSRRYMAKHLRVCSVSGGPFGLEYMRHTGKWQPIHFAVGDLEEIANHIAEDACGLCRMFDVDEG